jgi:hypothetical protein
MGRNFYEPTLFEWKPEGGVGYYQWSPGTYYWQAYRQFCGFAETSCTTPSPVWQFVATPIPPPEDVSPEDGATVPLRTTVEFVVHSAAKNDYRTELFISQKGEGRQFLRWDSASPDGSLLYFHWKASVAPATIEWTPARLDLKAGGEVWGSSRHLTIALPVSPTSPSGNPTPARTHAYCSSARERLGRINHRIVCLRAGEYCSWRYRQQYRRYHFACVRKGHRFRLVRRH